jgi:hypothetical protein
MQNQPLPSPETTPHTEKTYRACLFLACLSFAAWLANSWAISNNIRSIVRLVGKFHGR